MADKVGKRVGEIVGALRRYMEKVDLREYAELRKTLSKELERKTAEQWSDDEREQVVEQVLENIMLMIDETALYMCGVSMRFDPDDELFTALAKAGFHMAARAAVSTFLARFEGTPHNETLGAENDGLAASWNDFIQGINFDDLIDPDNPNADIWGDDND